MDKVLTPTNAARKVHNVRELMELSNKPGGVNFFYTLKNSIRRYKKIRWDGRTFHIDNGMTYQQLLPIMLMDVDKTLVGESIRIGTFYMCEYENEKIN